MISSKDMILLITRNDFCPIIKALIVKLQSQFLFGTGVVSVVHNLRELGASLIKVADHGCH